MFTGIIQQIGDIKKTASKNGSKVVYITKSALLKNLKTNDSVNIDGICSTVEEIQNDCFKVTYMPETLKLTTASIWQEKTLVNLEPALSLNDKLNGHMLQGHIDCMGEIKKITKKSDSYDIDIGFPKELSKFIALKGSVAVDGVSLTISFVDENFFSISLIPHTLENTTLGKKKENDKVNIEVDIISRYLLRLFEERDNQTSYEFLKERGFI